MLRGPIFSAGLTWAPIAAIAIAELKRAFFNPLAWIVLAFFCAQSGWVFAERLEFVAEGKALSATRAVFGDLEEGLFISVVNSLMVFIAFITMGSFAREYETNVIALLNSSSLSPTQIVLGKYIGLISFFGLYVLVLVVYAAHASFYIDDFQWGLVASGLLGISLLILVYTAIGVLVSSLLWDQVAAGITTIMLLLGMQVVGIVGQRMPILADVAYWMSVAGRTEYLVAGLVNSRDVIYFLVLTAAAVTAAIFGLGYRSRAYSLGDAALRGVSLLLISSLFVIAGAWRELVVYADLSSDRFMSLSPEMGEIVQGLDSDVDVTFFVNVEDPNAELFLPRNQRTLNRRLFDNFRQYTAEFDVQFRWYYNDLVGGQPGPDREANAELVAQRFAYKHRLDFGRVIGASQLPAGIDIRSEGFRTLALMESATSSVLIRVFDDRSYLPSETEIGSGVTKLQQGPVVIGYVDGRESRSALKRGGSNHAYMIGEKSTRSALTHSGFDIQEVPLDQPVGANLDILVLPGVEWPLDHQSMAHLGDYLDSGGNGLILLDPDVVSPGVTYLDLLGLKLSAEPVRGYEEGEFVPSGFAFGGPVRALFGLDERSIIWLRHAHCIDQSSNSDDFHYFPLLTIGREAPTRSGTADCFPGVAVTRSHHGQEQRWAVIADADFLSTESILSETLRSKKHGGFNFTYSLFHWLSGDRYPLPVSVVAPGDRAHSITMSSVKSARFAYVWVVSLIIVAFGLHYSSRRRSA